MESIKQQRYVYIIILLVMCLVSFGLGYFLFNAKSTKETKHVPINDSISLNATPIKTNDIVVKNSYVGYVEAINQVSIIPYVNGYLQNIPIKAGQFVNEGDLLVTINPKEYKAKLDSSIASVLQAQASFQYNKTYYDRVQKSGKNTFSETEIDNAKNNYKQSEAQLKEAEANKNFAQINYDYTRINAPISGLIGNIDLSIGDYVSPTSTPLLTIIQINPIRVVFSLTDKEYLNMKKDKTLFKDSVITLKLSNGDIYEHYGEFKYTDNKINKNTNSLAIYVYFKNDKQQLLPNAFVTVEINKTFKNIVLIDKTFIKMEDNGYFLKIARDNKIENVSVNILSDKNNQYIVENTFMTGDMLILDDTKILMPNQKVSFNIIK